MISPATASTGRLPRPHQVLGPHAERNLLAVACRRADLSGQRVPPAASTYALPFAAAQRAVDDVHRRRADELRDEQVVRPVVELERRADLLDAPSCITTMRSAIVIASIWSCVT